MIKKTNLPYFTIFGPCSLESWEQIDKVASFGQRNGLKFLRTPLFKPRTRPESFQGLGHQGLSILSKLREQYPELQFVGEVCSKEQLELGINVFDVIQIGARNMQNFELLKEIGRRCEGKLVLLKRGFANTLEEWLASAEYLIQYGVSQKNIILCERGSRHHASPTGVVLDFAMAICAQRRGFKVIIDPSHGSSERSLVLPLAQAALSIGFDGLMIECHPFPQQSYSDAHQALSLQEFNDFLRQRTNPSEVAHLVPDRQPGVCPDKPFLI